MAFYEPGDLGCHARLKRGDGQAIESSGSH
jgi:hypothetical protein